MFNTWKSGDMPGVASDVAAPPPGPQSPAMQALQRHAGAAAGLPSSNCSIINEWLTMRGDLESEGDILVKGTVYGNIRCKILIVDDGAEIEGGVNAEELVVRGSVRGTIKVKRIRLEKTASVDGEIYQDSFSAEEGAKIVGALKANAPEPSLPGGPRPDMSGRPERRGSSSLFKALDEARSNGQARKSSDSVWPGGQI